MSTEKPKITENELAANASVFRREVLAGMLDRYAGRDIDKECGYPNPVTSDYCKQLYDREGIATRVVTVFPEETWKHDPEVIETEDDTDTEFEKAWKNLSKRFNVFNVLQRADSLSGIGQFGIILLGIDDGLDLSKPIDGVLDSGELQPGTKQRKLLYMRTFDQTCVQIASFENDTTNPRFGKPKAYNINFQTLTMREGPQPPVSQTLVHWTRVIHIADNREDSEVYGVPRLQNVINRVYDLRKVLSSSGEMFWKGGFPGISFELQPGVQTNADLDEEGLKEQLDKYQNGLQRYLSLIGVSAKSLAVQVADPTPHMVTHVKAICMSKGIPWRIFLGSEEAKLASDQDSVAWNERIKNRQSKYITPMVLLPFVHRLIEIGILPPPKNLEEGVTVNWPDLHTPSDQDKAMVASTMTDAIQKYISGGCDEIFPPKMFLTLICGFSDERADAILESAQEHLTEVDGMHDHLHGTDQQQQEQAAQQQEHQQEMDRQKLAIEAKKVKVKAS
jgi:hypothetical protein